MARIMSLLAAAIAYFCIATIVAQVVLAITFASRWQLDRSKLMNMLAVAYGIDSQAAQKDEHRPADGSTSEMPSYDQVLEARAIKIRHIELREQALRQGLDQLRNDQQGLAEEKKRFKQVRETFDTELTAMRDGASATGTEEVRRTLETIKSKQAKEQILKMLEDDQLDHVVELLAGMSDTKRAKILNEFETPEEADRLREILERLGQGTPPPDAIDETRQKLAPPARGGA
ncbi:MAG: hypothetical protein ACOY3P_22410 [Planctomycetota bacterium]